MRRHSRLRPLLPALLASFASSLGFAGNAAVDETPKTDELAVTVTVTAERAASDTFDQPATVEPVSNRPGRTRQ